MSTRTVEEFGACLRQLKVWAGDPSFAELQRRCGVPASTLADALSSRRSRLPRLDVVRIMVRACGGGAEDVARWESGWRRLQERLERPASPEPPRAHRPHQLPRGPARFVGHEPVLERLHELQRLRAAHGSQPPLVALTGPPGVGKTALALHWGHRMAAEYPDGQLYFDLRGVARAPAVDADVALPSLLNALGVPPGELPFGVSARASLFRSITYSRRMLVVLDNARDAEHVRQLLPSGPWCFTLVTSRDRLSGLVAREDAVRLPVEPLQPREAERLVALMLDDERVAREPSAARELVRLCGHLPLALRIAATELADHPEWSISAYAVRLAADDRLARLTATGDEPGGVRAAFDASYSALDETARSMFRLLGGMPGSAFRAEDVALLDGSSAADVARRLELLVAAHLLERTGPDRYAMHDLARLYAEDIAAEGALALAAWVPAQTAPPSLASGGRS